MAQSALMLQQCFKLGGLTLIPFADLDEQQVITVWQMRNHPDVAHWMSSGGEIPFEAHLAFMARQRQETHNFNYLCQDALGSIGVVSLHRLDWNNRLAWLGIYRNPSRRGEQLGAPLLAAVQQLAFDVARLHSLKLEVATDNERAIQAYQRAGFRREGAWREAVFRQDQQRFIDLLLMGITEQEWRHP
ncbi:UDP-4-amino-4,6-dideoxy-N-acetyl-beta-L-altrosamine N-acetyltransferase [Aeromonas lusitana]|uniref:UDP-4-amino-4, 6-dideoxy-N-acetyl-beta-L-altrosamine N-acetyltransferase n=1 Tax=Aeromonas lusitana TaxID=931529 RepID=A0A2M8H9K1_9GAMM|nr:UDP-4-amino-4,6-dideoxy-N-acetyl-beta-L-altrosamine N-acetyltransferase [Aeromonas lusitana]PJC93247.1 UDP-4-amino-4,6-dideoxy-N-acetyl-beta-L-altrosamine N-acetyltransferase [Aeromonas lusitana]